MQPFSPGNSKVVDRSKPPLPGPVSLSQFPPWQETVLANGLRVMIFEDHESPIAYVRLYTKTGSINDGEKLRLASLTYSLLTHGTATRSGHEIADTIDFLGAELTSSAGMDRANISLTTMSKFLDQGLELMADVVLNANFLEDEIEFLRVQALNRLQVSKSEPGRLATDAFMKAVYQNHPYGNPSVGTEAATNSLTRNYIQSFYDAYSTPNNSFIVVAGDVDATQILLKLERAFGGWKQKPVPVSHFAAPQMREKNHVIVVHKEGSVQSTLYLGHLCIQKNHPDFIKCYMMNTILGGYFGSRLNMNLREEKGYTYSIRSGLDGNKFLGDFYVSVQVRNEVTRPAIDEIFREINRMIQEKVSAEELQVVKNYISGVSTIRNESPSSIAGRIATTEIYDLPKDYNQTLVAKVNALTREDILEAAQTYVHPSKMSIVLSGDAQAVAKSLEDFGDMAIVDADGAPIV
ncbi:MAG: insulinase family protein [Chlorobiales bacterium]|nr:insulinase family protein [Chlorobiales bacterium]